MSNVTLDNLRITRSVMISWRAWQRAKEEATRRGMSVSRYIEQLVLGGGGDAPTADEMRRDDSEDSAA